MRPLPFMSRQAVLTSTTSLGAAAAGLGNIVHSADLAAAGFTFSVTSVTAVTVCWLLGQARRPRGSGGNFWQG
jgi:hypothetical protein